MGELENIAKIKYFYNKFQKTIENYFKLKVVMVK